MLSQAQDLIREQKVFGEVDFKEKARISYQKFQNESSQMLRAGF
jgi:hypothetical protein